MYRTKTILLLAEINLTEFVKNQIFATAEPKTHAFETKLRVFSLSPPQVVCAEFNQNH